MYKLLIIDDSHEHLEIINDIFVTEGHSVTACDNSFDALKMLSENPFDCVISDLKIPVIDGHHLLSIIHEKHPEIPVVILSAYIEDETELINKGAYAVLKKPPNISSLISAVDNAVHDSANSVSFIFCHTELKKIQDTVISKMIRLALKKSNGNQAKAAQFLGISRQSLIRYIKKFKMTTPV
jgi:DNA-binding NtrC family response regulator